MKNLDIMNIFQNIKLNKINDKSNLNYSNKKF